MTVESVTEASPTPEVDAPPKAPRRRGRLLLWAAVAWLVFVLAHRLISGHWYAWIIADLLPPIIFTGVPVLLLALSPLARYKRRWTVAVTVLALLLGLPISGFNPAAVIHGPTPVPPGALHIVSFNTTVWNIRDPHPDDFFTMLTGLNADVYLLQEYKPYDEVTGRSVDPDRLGREFPGYHIVIRGELVTLSRLPIVNTVALPVDPPAGSDWRTDYWEVKTLRTDLRVGDGVLSVYNVHMLVPLDLSSPLKRSFWRTREDWNARRQKQYAGLEHDLDGNRNPTVVAGDFNTSPSMGDRNGVASRLNDAARASTSVYPTSWKSDWLALWRVDWAFTNDAVDVHTYKLVPHNDMSDHRLQDMTVSLKASR